MIPVIKNKMSQQQQDTFETFVNIGVYAAEQLYNSDQGKEKKQYVLDFLAQKGYKVDIIGVEQAIEAAVKALRLEQGVWIQ